MVLNFFLELAQLENSPADLPKGISTLLRTEQCDIAVLSIDDVGGDIVTWERLAVRLALACGISEDTESMSYMCVHVLDFVYTMSYCVYSEPHTRGPLPHGA